MIAALIVINNLHPNNLSHIRSERTSMGFQTNHIFTKLLLIKIDSCIIPLSKKNG